MEAKQSNSEVSEVEEDGLSPKGQLERQKATGLGFTTPEAEDKKKSGKRNVSSQMEMSGDDDVKILGKRMHQGAKKSGENVTGFPPIKRKRGRPAKNDAARMHA